MKSQNQKSKVDFWPKKSIKKVNVQLEKSKSNIHFWSAKIYFRLLTFDFDSLPLFPPPNFFLTKRKTGTKFSCQIMDDEKKTDDKNFFCSGNNLSQGDGECIPQN